LGEQWNAHRFPGSNSPYWSLGFEVWYYIAFGGFVFSPHRWRWIVVSIVLVFIGPKVTLMFPVWLMGVATYRVCTGVSEFLCARRGSVPPIIGSSTVSNG
jgi:peptidoglycan/LPS O-acetylase OafA/YrhL